MNNRTSDPQPWKLIKQESGPSLKVFASRFEYRRNPRNGKELECLILDSKDWVNIVALTKEKEVVLVKQFRFGSASVTIDGDPMTSLDVTAPRVLIRQQVGHAQVGGQPG